MDKTFRDALLVVLFFFIAIFSIARAWRNTVILTICLFIGATIVLWLWHTPADLTVFFIAGVVGPIGESIVIAGGAWSYTQPHFLGTPVWLPLVWGLAGIMFLKLAALGSYLFAHDNS